MIPKITVQVLAWLGFAGTLLRWTLVFFESDPAARDTARSLAYLSGIETAAWFVVLELVYRRKGRQ